MTGMFVNILLSSLCYFFSGSTKN